jgi:hypothetical protein
MKITGRWNYPNTLPTIAHGHCFYYFDLIILIDEAIMWFMFWKSYQYRVRVIVFNLSFNNFSAISWWSLLLVEETGVPGESHRPAARH